MVFDKAKAEINPLARTTGKNAPFSAPTDHAFNKGRQLHAEHRLCEGTPPATKNVGADSISARARLRQDKLPRAHIECAPTDLAFNIGLAGSGRYNKKRVCDILDVTDSWCAVQDSNL